MRELTIRPRADVIQPMRQATLGFERVARRHHLDRSLGHSAVAQTG